MQTVLAIVGLVVVVAIVSILVGVIAALVAGSRADDDMLGDRQYREDDDGYPPYGV